MIERITDPSDPRLSDYFDLTDVKLRRVIEPAEGLYMAESSKVITRALEVGHRPRSLLMTEKWLPALGALIDEAEQRFGPLPVYVGSDAVVEQLTGFHLHRGALAAMHRPATPSLVELVSGKTRIAVLDGLVDHTNVGAVLRSAAALGVEGVVLSPDCADPLYRRSVRVSMGAALTLPYARAGSWSDDLQLLRSEGFTLAALALRDDSVDLADFARALPDRVAWMLGSEGHGLSASALAAADVVVRIPMELGIDSLNVAAASAVAFWASRPGARPPSTP
ncbi:TrmH family RNA methyltransferase [Cellulomonas sp.]|uniref:TrmH family RNA methyltransferase n=1 Tax=Cellulomonas sp. TaxID=40001 RepID=UPI003BAD3B7D